MKILETSTALGMEWIINHCESWRANLCKGNRTSFEPPPREVIKINKVYDMGNLSREARETTHCYLPSTLNSWPLVGRNIQFHWHIQWVGGEGVPLEMLLEFLEKTLARNLLKIHRCYVFTTVCNAKTCELGVHSGLWIRYFDRLSKR